MTRRWIAWVAAIGLTGALPALTSSPYYLDLFIITMINAVLAMTFVMLLRTGLINMSLVAFWGAGAYACALFLVKWDTPFWLSLPGAWLITALLALVLGYVLIGSGSSGFSFVMLSAVVGMLFGVLVGNIDYLEGYVGISAIPGPERIDLPLLPAVAFTSKVSWFYLALVLIVVIAVVCHAFYRSRAGRACTAIGLNHRLAASVGMNVTRYKLLAFVLGSSICGVIGAFYASYETYVSPDAYTMWLNIYIQLCAVLGGLGYPIAGPIVGAGVMTFLPEGLRIADEIAPIILGSLLILFILFLPKGLLSLGSALRSGIGVRQWASDLRLRAETLVLERRGTEGA